MMRILAYSVAACFAASTSLAGQITVSGTGEIAVVPDMATLTVGVSEQAASAGDAVSLMSDAMAVVLAELSNAGISPRNMQTSSLRVDRVEDYDNITGKRSLNGYRASNRVTVQVLELDGLGRLLDSAFDSGANDLGQLQFGVQDRAPHLQAARRLAVADAKVKAEIFADAAGVTLGDLVSLTEGGARSAPIVMMEMARQADGVPLAEGELTINATITMVYETR